MSHEKKDQTMKKSTDASYTPADIEPRWQKRWEEAKVYQPDLNTANKPFYNLMMFPYPSAEGLHVGNMYAQTGADVFGRFKRMQGYQVFEPMGLDGFGIHSENYALKVGSHPMEQIAKAEQNFYRQMRAIGTGIDWSRTVETWKPDYYKWTQWCFIELFKAGLAYRAASDVNWCPSCKTVLADEQVEEGKCERCGSVVEKRTLEQWFFRITDYAQRLLDDIEKIDWTEKVKIAQRNWIGKSKGAKISFRVILSANEGSQESDSSATSPSTSAGRQNDNYLEVFTTRPDTLHGATFMVVSPEHGIVAQILNQVQDDKIKQAVRRYLEQAAAKTERERTEEGKEKTGVFSGAYAINPVTNMQIPIWIADYVLASYGTGAIMAVPAHDQRDYDFAKKYNLPIIDVVVPSIVDQGNPPQAGKENTKRHVILAIVYDPKTEKYLTLQWKEREWMSFVTGGVEVGEDVVEAAKREIAEETGYTDLSFVCPLGGPVEAFFFAAHKGVNRQTRTNLLLFEMNSDKQQTIASEEYASYEAVWLTKQEIQAQSFRHAEMSLIWQRIENESAYAGNGVLINSNEWDGWKTPEAKDKAIAWLEMKGIGKGFTNYHLRDWLISRQRYWGPPIPMIYCESCAKAGKSWFTTDEAKEWKNRNSKFAIRNSTSTDVGGWYPSPELPVVLPEIDDYRPLGTGNSPLGNHPEFYETVCPACSGKARRETDVSDTFLDSSWYFLRYLAADISTLPFPMEAIAAEAFPGAKEGEVTDAIAREKWLPVNQYIGGAEHSVLHLLYTRFFYKVLVDLGYLDAAGGDEPFPNFYAHGLIIKDGAKMSKSKGNVVVPDIYMKKFGADTLRTYLMFLGPFSIGGDFQDAGIDGINRYLKRVWKLLTTKVGSSDMDSSASSTMHRTIKGVSEDLSSLRYNTAIAKLMTWYNELAKRETITVKEAVIYLKLLAPFAPHLAEELYQRLEAGSMKHEVGEEQERNKEANHNSSFMLHDSFTSIHSGGWPEYDEALMVEDTVTIAIQVNGKLRDTVTVASDSDQQKVERAAKVSEKVQSHIVDKEIKKVIYVPGKILNLVVG